jgi:hypothetical protein
MPSLCTRWTRGRCFVTTDGGSAGTAANGYKVPPAIPQPRNGDNDPRWPYDPAEPGRRRDTNPHGRPR